MCARIHVHLGVCAWCACVCEHPEFSAHSIQIHTQTHIRHLFYKSANTLLASSAHVRFFSYCPDISLSPANHFTAQCKRIPRALVTLCNCPWPEHECAVGNGMSDLSARAVQCLQSVCSVTHVLHLSVHALQTSDICEHTLDSNGHVTVLEFSGANSIAKLKQRRLCPGWRLPGFRCEPNSTSVPKAQRDSWPHSRSRRFSEDVRIAYCL